MKKDILIEINGQSNMGCLSGTYLNLVWKKIGKTENNLTCFEVRNVNTGSVLGRCANEGAMFRMIWVTKQ